MKKYILTIASALLALGACTHNEPQLADAIETGTDVLSFDSKGSTQQISVRANCDWTASADADWVLFTPENGKSNTTAITVTVGENPSEDERRATLSIASDAKKVEVTIVQRGPVAGFDGHIRSAEDFNEFARLAAEFSEGEVIDFEADVDMAGADLKPIASFKGVLDGKGHKLYNFSVISEYSNAGLILENSGTVKDIYVGTADGKNWDGKSTIRFVSSESVGISAGLVAINYGTLEKVRNFVSVDFNCLTAGDGYGTVGGVCGRSGSESAVFRACENHGRVSFTGTMAYKSVLGGVLGYNVQPGITVEDCVNYASIDQATVNKKEYAMAGVVGRSDIAMNIRGCRNEGSISYSCTEAPGSYIHIAGIAGALYKGCKVENCTNAATVRSSILQVNRMGGIVGTVNSGGDVLNCVNEGEVCIDQSANDNWQAAGGIVGFEEKCSSETLCHIEGCTNKGAVNIAVNNATTHANKVCAGGIIGFSCSSTDVKGNTNEGPVSIVNAGTGAVYAGGILGWYTKGSAWKSSENLNKANVDASGSAAAAGGVVGNASIASCNISNETNRGAISCSVASACGSIAGLSAAALTSCCVGGVVNSTEVTAANFESLIQGSASTGTPVGCYFDGGSGPVPYIIVDKESLNFPFGGDSKELGVDANCAWTVSTTASWLNLSPAQGDSEVKTVSVTASANEVKESRSAEIVFTATDNPALRVTVSVSQEPYVDGLPGNAIASASDWKKFAALAGDASASDSYTLSADITIPAAEFSPIPSFAGVLNGGGYTITIDGAESELNNVALIQTLSGTVRNLAVAGSLKTSFDGSAQHYLASVAGIVNGGLVENCSSSATLELSSGSGTAYAVAGGIVADLQGDGATVSGCSYSGKLSVLTSCPGIVGGVLGYGESSADAPSISILNCSMSGELIVNHSASNWDYIGGVVGKMGASKNPFTKYTIRDCSTSGSVTIVKAPKVRGGGVLGSSGASTDYEVSGCSFTGLFDIQSTEEVDRLCGAVGPGFSEAAATGTVSNCTFDGSVKAVNGGKLYLAGIYGNNGSASVVIDNCKTTARSSISGFTAAKSIALIAARPNKAGFTVKNCKVAGKVVDVTAAEPAEITVTADNIADWMFKGSGTTVNVTLENNGYNAE